MNNITRDDIAESINNEFGLTKKIALIWSMISLKK